MWHVSSRSGVTTLRTAIHLLLTDLLTYKNSYYYGRESDRPTLRGEFWMAKVMSEM